MQIEQEEPGAGPVVTALRGRAFVVAERVFDGGLILTPRVALPFEGAVTAASVEPALTLDPAPEFLLLGTGPTLEQPDGLFRESLLARGIGLGGHGQPSRGTRLGAAAPRGPLDQRGAAEGYRADLALPGTGGGPPAG